MTIVLDPGHGGPDGGAVSPDGIPESRLNLDIAFRLRDLLEFAGYPCVMTRTEDISVHTPGASRWKASDLQNRASLANATPNSVLLSIHQNSLPSSPVTHGAQVFYNALEQAEVLSESVQSALNYAINQDNPKEAKPSPKGIYLMKHTTAPALLIECGFLSNEKETQLLQKSSHQLKLATAITAGVLSGT